MKILISGICGFVGSVLARALLEHDSATEIVGLDNLIRAGSYRNAETLQRLGVQLRHADLRSASDLESLAPMDWIIDAAANASVLAGVAGSVSSRQLIEHNLYGTVNLLEVAKKYQAGFVLLSTSRVYSIDALAALQVEARDNSYRLLEGRSLPPGLSKLGISEAFSTAAPISLYGASKLASECLALEYGESFGVPVWINRCGVLAGAGQFGRSDQGIFSFWINSYLRGAPLKYIGFGGTGFQLRDCFHPRDLVPLLVQQIATGETKKPRVINLGGGLDHSISLAQLSDWCANRFCPRQIDRDPKPRLFDLPWVVMDSTLAGNSWDWQPTTTLDSILSEIADHAGGHPEWLELSGAL
ncbi:MAG: NAD-dependent epimerase/dehydratase family protein [Chthoniobacterales bacterium]